MNSTILKGFARWMLREVAERTDEEGQTLKRGQRRFRTESGEQKRYRIRGKSISYSGRERFRDNDLSFRLALAVRAFQKSGLSNWEACLTVAEEPIVVARLGKSNRRPKSLKNPDDTPLVRRAETIRSLANKYMKRFKDSFEQEFLSWLECYRSDFCCDGDWYAEQEPIYKARIVGVEKDHGQNDPLVAMSHLNLARLYHEQSKYVEAKRSYQKAAEFYRSATVLEDYCELVLECITKEIENCRRRNHPIPLPNIVELIYPPDSGDALTPTC